MIKNGKMVESFVVFAKIILLITIFFIKFFKGNVRKISIEGASDFRLTNNFLPQFFAEVKISLKFRFVHKL